MNRNHYTAIGILLFIILVWTPSRSQSPSFDLSFRVDTESAEELLRYLEGTSFNPARITQSRGTQLAATTSLLLARTTESVELQRALEMIRNGVTPNEDLFGLTDVRQALPFVRKLLDETKKRQLDRRIRGTLSSYFPADLELHASVPVYVVAFGNEKAAAFVRRVVWNGNTPVFVGESDGEPVIVLNLARCMFSDKLEVQFTEMLAILAHECFHAAFSLAQQQHPNTPIPHNAMEALAELAQNEGIAYLLSMQIHHGGTAPTREWLSATSRAVQELLKTMSLDRKSVV